ncbi:MAG: Mov34/MPN/PAD-1 family protein [Firmicutes bacterium]|nr:Mov34/MPN/PAD-1 family protein [Bacillota bacterium]
MNQESTATLRIPLTVLQDSTAYCHRRLPYESGGFLVGRNDGDGVGTATRFMGVETAIMRTNGFMFRACDVFEALLTCDQQGEVLLATVHSHPYSAPIPSVTDLTVACGHASLLHLIIGFSSHPPEYALYAYMLAKDKTPQPKRLAMNITLSS